MENPFPCTPPGTEKRKGERTVQSVCVRLGPWERNQTGWKTRSPVPPWNGKKKGERTFQSVCVVMATPSHGVTSFAQPAVSDSSVREEIWDTHRIVWKNHCQDWWENLFRFRLILLERNCSDSPLKGEPRAETQWRGELEMMDNDLGR